MNIFVNGAAADPRNARDIAELVEQLGFPAATVLIEHNGLALHRREWSERSLGEGDRVEVLRVVAGG